MREAEPKLEDGPEAEAERVAAALEQVRAGVRQQQALLATYPEVDELPASLAEVRRRQYLQRPIPSSHRPFFGRFVVLAKKAFYHLFMKWYLRPMLQQQNDFNEAVSIALQDLFERQAALARGAAVAASGVERASVSEPENTAASAPSDDP